MGLVAWFKKRAVDAAFDSAKEFVTVELIKDSVLAGVNKVVTMSTGKVSDETMTKWCNGFSSGSRACATIATSLAPASEGGRAVTAKEAQEIYERCGVAVDSLLTQEVINEKIEQARAAVKAKLGL